MAKLLNTLGVSTVVASLSDYDKITELAAAANVVINTVSRPLSPFRPNLCSTHNRRVQTALRLYRPFFVVSNSVMIRRARLLSLSTRCALAELLLAIHD